MFGTQVRRHFGYPSRVSESQIRALVLLPVELRTNLYFGRRQKARVTWVVNPRATPMQEMQTVLLALA